MKWLKKIIQSIIGKDIQRLNYDLKENLSKKVMELKTNLGVKEILDSIVKYYLIKELIARNKEIKNGDNSIEFLLLL